MRTGQRLLAGLAILAFTASVATPLAAALPTRSSPLSGIVVGIDPGHNGENGANPTYISHLVWNGRAWESCDTTGTATDSGYTETLYNWAVAVQLRALLRAQGARVVMTRDSNRGVGPCVDQRAYILDRARVDVAIDIHADGGPPGGRGFAILVPVPSAQNHAVVGSSAALALFVRSSFFNVAHMPWSTYDGVRAIAPRADLAGLNLTTVPKVLIECGNMRNATDASMLTSPTFQKRAATALLVGMTQFLRAEGRLAH